jgi:hypothetical protein
MHRLFPITSLAAVVGLSLVLTACAPRYTLRTPADLARLPQNRGMNGGSYVANTDWQYRGSDASFHYFSHYHNRDNILLRRSVRIPRSVASLGCSEHPVAQGNEWVLLEHADTAHVYFACSPAGAK